ncbi:hypothetical protein BCY86_04935 [Pajaroellobacter abortibovis]|uniref:Uncharacterized protein n=1 Tax=Pajaroellobacter abortibovis TaxID=1882918 RepID=A0A1L6MXB3_9BACT|nr:hypothetical protein BCY86_04935 [Pajaroellobacter abortibovis]
MAKRVELFADSLSFERLHRYYSEPLLCAATPRELGKEFLDYKMSIKIVSSLELKSLKSGRCDCPSCECVDSVYGWGEFGIGLKSVSARKNCMRVCRWE